MIFLFDKDKNIIGNVLPKFITQSPKLVMEIGQVNTLDFAINSEIKKIVDISNVAYVGVHHPRTSGSNPAYPNVQQNRYLLFKVNDVQDSTTELEFKAVDFAKEELSTVSYIKDRRLTLQTLSQHLNVILADTGWEIGSVNPATETFTNNYYYTDPYTAIQDLMKLCGGIVEFYIQIDSNKITHKYVRIDTDFGRDTSLRFEYPSNVINIKSTTTQSEIFTAIIPRGKGEENTSTSGDTTYGRRLKISDVTWSKAKGDPLDKPAGQEYLEDPDATKKYGFNNGSKPRIHVQTYDDIADVNTLIKAGYRTLMSSSRPKTQYTVPTKELGDAELGDKVILVNTQQNIAVKVTIFKITYDLLNYKLSVAEFGDDIVGERDILQTLADVQKQTAQNAQDIVDTRADQNGGEINPDDVKKAVDDYMKGNGTNHITDDFDDKNWGTRFKDNDTVVTMGSDVKATGDKNTPLNIQNGVVLLTGRGRNMSTWGITPKHSYPNSPSAPDTDIIHIMNGTALSLLDDILVKTGGKQGENADQSFIITANYVTNKKQPPLVPNANTSAGVGSGQIWIDYGGDFGLSNLSAGNDMPYNVYINRTGYSNGYQRTGVPTPFWENITSSNVTDARTLGKGFLDIGNVPIKTTSGRVAISSGYEYNYGTGSVPSQYTDNEMISIAPMEKFTNSYAPVVGSGGWRSYPAIGYLTNNPETTTIGNIAYYNRFTPLTKYDATGLTIRVNDDSYNSLVYGEGSHVKLEKTGISISNKFRFTPYDSGHNDGLTPTLKMGMPTQAPLPEGSAPIDYPIRIRWGWKTINGINCPTLETTYDGISVGTAGGNGSGIAFTPTGIQEFKK